ncbi:MAG: hypothetical protein KAI17_03400 [Thiotrichaceae bacterium]|nr:hypothetical protein [Thiotrichaceae bacterium]
MTINTFNAESKPLIKSAIKGYMAMVAGKSYLGSESERCALVEETTEALLNDLEQYFSGENNE